MSSKDPLPSPNRCLTFSLRFRDEVLPGESASKNTALSSVKVVRFEQPYRLPTAGSLPSQDPPTARRLQVTDPLRVVNGRPSTDSSVCHIPILS